MYKIIGADGKEYGPAGLDVVRQWIAEGRADARTRVLAEGGAEWKPIGEVAELAALLPAASAPPVPVLVATGAAPRNHPLAIASLVMGILALCCVCCYGVPFNVLGIIFGAIALSQINRDPAGQKGRGMAIAGLALSILSIIVALLFLILGLAINGSDLMHRFQNF